MRPRERGRYIQIILICESAVAVLSRRDLRLVAGSGGAANAAATNAEKIPHAEVDAARLAVAGIAVAGKSQSGRRCLRRG